uniref:Uncharacterized protein n=2 Tax=Avena sativa TaxID=4498 RepID=A0ACD6A7A4_AVESA
MDMLKGDIESRQGQTTTLLPDDLVVDIMSRLPLKSFCRFKCVCRSWFAFSSDPHHRQRLPRTPSGLLYQKRLLGTSIHLARLPSSDRDIDTTLSFVPCSVYPLKIKDVSNGLLLSYRKGNTHAEISNAIVCNPATEEWMALPDTHPGPTVTRSHLRLCFDPQWSQHFYVFNSEWGLIPTGGFKAEVKVFFSEDSTWSNCLCEIHDAFWGGSVFVNGVLYVQHVWAHYLLALDAPNTCSQLINDRTIQLPGFPNKPEKFDCPDGCLCQSSGVLCYAQQELDGCMMRIWSLEGSDRWVVKHRLSMNGVFGREMLLRTDNRGAWYFDYDIVAFDLERELVIVVDRITHKVFSVSVGTGKLSKIRDDIQRPLGYYYVPYYCKFPALAR